MEQKHQECLVSPKQRYGYNGPMDYILEANRMGRRRVYFWMILALGSPVGVVGSVQDTLQADTKAPLRIGTLVEIQDPPPTLPDVTIRSVSGYDDDQAYRREIAEQTAKIVKSAQEEDNQKVRAELLLAAANLILARQFEPAYTAKLLDIRGLSFDSAEAVDMLDQADSLILRAQEALNKNEGDADASVEAVKDRLVTLLAFAGAVRGYLITAEDQEKTHAVRRAVSALSPVLEHENAHVAAAANLWQACLRSADGNPSRAIESLPFPSANIDKDTMPYAFFAKPFRCRLHGSRGGYAASIAMLIQIEERCEDWFESQKDQADALRTTRWMQLRMLFDWYESFDASKQAKERRWCADRIEALKVDSFGTESKTVLRISPAIPLIFPTPVLSSDSSAPTTVDNETGVVAEHP